MEQCIDLEVCKHGIRETRNDIIVLNKIKLEREGERGGIPVRVKRFRFPLITVCLSVDKLSVMVYC